jgi:hypothetical protein
MKNLKLAACALLLIGPALAAHAESTLTRAQVRQELAELQAAGYRPSLVSSPDFPENMQAVMQRAARPAPTPPATATTVMRASKRASRLRRPWSIAARTRITEAGAAGA